MKINSQGLRQKDQISYAGRKIKLALDLNKVYKSRETSAFSTK